MVPVLFLSDTYTAVASDKSNSLRVVRDDCVDTVVHEFVDGGFIIDLSDH
jgi:hypothetical protein